MSKEAAVRAMREARYNERVAASSAASGAAPEAPRPAVRPAVRPATPPAADPVAPESATEGRCGHRSMNGRTCTREQGHAAKSHRYS